MIANYINTILIFLILIFFFTTLSLASIFLSINTIFSTFNLILVFLMSSLMLFFVDLEFMAIVYTTIYVGAVSIFFIFILMTINLRFNDTWEYTDEVYYDRNFSFFILFIFSVLFHDIFYINFRYFLDFKNLLDYYFIFKNQRESHHHLDFLNGLYKTDNFLIDTFANLDFNFFLKPYLYSDIHLLAVNLFTELRMIFLIVTMLLLFSMLASIGFAIRSK